MPRRGCNQHPLDTPSYHGLTVPLLHISTAPNQDSFKESISVRHPNQKGRVLDGTGAPWFKANVATVGKSIVAGGMALAPDGPLGNPYKPNSYGTSPRALGRYFVKEGY